jgi:hypothetical protein
VRKRLISPIRSTAVVRESGWLDLDQAALVEVTSEAEGWFLKKRPFPVLRSSYCDGCPLALDRGKILSVSSGISAHQIR